jgi:hypothetical protein
MKTIWRLVISAILLTPLVCAQTPGSTNTPPGSQDPSQQGSNTQPPQSPLSQQPTSTIQQQEADQQKQKQSNTTFDTSSVSNTSEDVQLGEIRIFERYSEANGDPTKSFRVDPHTIDKQCFDFSRDPITHVIIPGPRVFQKPCEVGAFYQQYEFNYFMDRSIGNFWAGHRFQLLAQYRGTSDFSIDPERNSLQKGYIRLFSTRDEIIVGDALVNYSRLSFNQNVKGVAISYLLNDDWKVSATGGVFIDRYGSLYKPFSALPGRPYMATVFGGRIERKVNRTSTIGLNFSSSVDQTQTLPQFQFDPKTFLPVIDPITLLPIPIANGTAPIPISNQLVSVDSKLNFKNGLRVDGEFAYSFTDFDRRGCIDPLTKVLCVTSTLDPRTPQTAFTTKQGDWAGRIEGSYRIHKFSMRASFIRYQPNFASQNARQISDLQDWMLRASYDLTNWLAVDGTVRRSNNDLNKQLSKPLPGGTQGYETILWGPEMKFIFHDLPFYKRATIEAGFRDRNTSSTFGIVNRNVRIPYTEFTIPVQRAFVTLGYERRQVQDRVDARQTSNTDRVYAGLRGIFELGKWQVTPAFRYELERQSNRPALCTTATPIPAPPAVPLCGTVPNVPPGDTSYQTKEYTSNRLGSAALYIEAPKWFIFEGQFRANSATITAMNPRNVIVVVSGIPTNFVTFDQVPSGYSRPTYKASLTYKINNDENFLFNFSLERNSYFFFQNPTANYDERIWQGGIIYRFGRKNR